MDPALSLAAELMTNTSGGRSVEVEYRYGTTKLEEFETLIQNVAKLGKYKFDITQQADYSNNDVHVRQEFSGGRSVAKIGLKKVEHRRDTSHHNGKIVVATEEILPTLPTLDMKDLMCFLKLRLSFRAHNWTIDFTARQTIRNTQSIDPTIRMYFARDVSTIAEYTKKCRDLTFNNYVVEIEYDTSRDNPIKDLRAGINDLVAEFNLLMQYIFAEDTNLEFTQLLAEAVATYRAADVGGRTKTIRGVTTQVQAMSRTYLRNNFPLNGWYVSDKPDGLHCLVLVSSNGGVYALPDKVLTLVKPFEGSGAEHDRQLFEGELIVKSELVTCSEPSLLTENGKPYEGHIFVPTTVTGTYEKLTPMRLIIFNVIYYDKNPVYSGSFENQLTYLDEAVEYLRDQLRLDRATDVGKSITVDAKKFYKLTSSTVGGPRNPNGDPNMLDLTAYQNAIDSALRINNKKYETDGLIFIEPGDSYDTTNSFKWKPESQNTIDFLAMLVPDQLYSTYPNLARDGHSLYILYVTANASQLRALGLCPLPFNDQVFPNMSNKGQNRPIHFVTPMMQMVHFFYYRDKSLHQKIIELTPCWVQAANKSKAFAWKFNRIREDRQLDFESGMYYGNNIVVAGTNFASFLHPTTIEDVKGNFTAGYFIKNHSSVYNAATAHSSAVKGYIFDTYFKDIDVYVDYAAGRADFKRYRNINKRVFAVDIDADGLMDLLDRHYDSARRKSEYVRCAELVIINTNLNNPYQKTLELLISRKIPTRTSINSGAGNNKLIVIADGAACNMAAHYLVYTADMMANFIGLIKNTLHSKAKFAFTMMDGRKLYEFLRGRPNPGEWIAYDDTVRKYHIKIDTAYPMPPGGSVPVSLVLPFTNGKMVGEYLIDVEHFIGQFEKAGFAVVERLNFGNMIGKVGNKLGELSEDDRVFLGFYIGVVLEKK